jgi:hypothetical protein
MYQVCIYNYDRSLEETLLLFIELLMDGHSNFISKSWEGGPHLQIVTRSKPTKEIISKLKKKLDQLIDQHPLEASYVKKIQNQYERNLSLLSKLENKKQIKKIREHGEVEVCPFEFFFHNQLMTQLYVGERFKLNQLLMDTKKYLITENLSEAELFPLIFAKISNVYQQNGNNKGYFSFISHVHGFFELSEKQDRPYSESVFEKIYQEKQLKFEYLKKIHSKILERWANQFSQFYYDCLEQVDQLVDEAYRSELERTITELEKNFQNDFHQNFVHYSRQKNFMENSEATAYRFTINLLYLVLPFFNISALKKQQYLYLAYREVEKEKGITWREELGLGINN